MIKKKMQMGGKAKPMSGKVGAYAELEKKAKAGDRQGKLDLKLEKSNYKKFGDGPGSGPSGAMPKPKMQMGGDMKKSKDNSSFAKLAPPYDKATFADKIAGATKGKSSTMKMGGKMAKQAAVAIAMKKAGKTPKKKMQYGGEAASMVPMKKGGMVKKCKSGCY